MQQEVCFVHVRLSIASGHVVPDVTYKSRLISEVAENTQSGLSSSTDISKVKIEGPPNIDFEKLEENDLRETLSKLKGFRVDRDLIVETLCGEKLSLMSNKKFPGAVEEEMNKSAEDGGKNSTHVLTYAATVNNSLRKKENKSKKQTDGSPINKATKKAFARSKGKTGNEIKTTNGSTTGQLNTSTEAQAFSPSSTASYLITSVSFFSGNPAVDITNGIIHIYKTNFKSSIGEELPPPATETICMLSVPASIDVHNLLEFTAPYIEVVHQMRIIRDRTPNQYMVLLTFISEKNACEFYLNLNNQPFSSLIPEEVCRLAFVASVEALAPPGVNDVKKDARFLPIPNSTELPDCMVCLERMDESVQGLLTVLCNHSFHAACLQKWEDLCCPVCRYVQTPEPQSDNKCMVCGAAEDLWICLICGHVGCGRYTSEHASRHYMETHHNYAMSLSDNRVWDYAGDYFVHRLFQNKDDGKLVEKNSSGEQEAKLEGIQLECMHLLTTQLESQRKYWEDQVAKVEQSANIAKEEVVKKLKKQSVISKEMQGKITALEKDKQSLSHKNEKLAAKLRESLRDLMNEREMNKSLTQNQDGWKERVNGLEERCIRQESELKDLQEQLRDVMFYIEASQKIKNEDQDLQEELREGQVVVGPSTSSESPGSKARAKGKRKTR